MRAESKANKKRPRIGGEKTKRSMPCLIGAWNSHHRPMGSQCEGTMKCNNGALLLFLPRGLLGGGRQPKKETFAKRSEEEAKANPNKCYLLIMVVVVVSRVTLARMGADGHEKTSSGLLGCLYSDL